jgi:glycosyltransferase involved in cell wall biosynthesis
LPMAGFRWRSLHAFGERVSTMKIAVAICTTGRPEVIARCVALLARQHRQADRIVVCGAASADIAGLETTAGLTLIVSPRKGLTIQRNVALDTIGDGADIVLFMDDDFLLHDTYVQRVERLFEANPQLVAATGRVVADGINSDSGYSFHEAEAILTGTDLTPPDGARNEWIEGVYGCNFAIRQAAVIRHSVRFDERLPLYGWQEDIDFTTQLSRFGKVLRTDALLGVHLGVKGGRQSGLRLGYSQVSNPIYLARKGTMRPGYALKLVARNLAANVVGSLKTRSKIDRRGRLRGNLMALQDVFLRRRVTPERILEL